MTNRTRAGGWSSGLLSALTWALLVLVLGLAVALAVVPRLAGGAALTVLSGSMEPAFSPGDMIVSVPRDAYRLGELVTYQPVPDDSTLVTHRVVGKRPEAEQTWFVTRGDANGVDDAPIKAEQIMGRVAYHVPYVGHAVRWAGDQAGMLITGVGVALLLYAAIMLVRPAPRATHVLPGRGSPPAGAARSDADVPTRVPSTAADQP